MIFAKPAALLLDTAMCAMMSAIQRRHRLDPSSAAALERYIDGGGVLSANLFHRRINNLMRGNAAPPRPQLNAVIDRDLFHRTVGHLSGGDVLEFN